MPFDIRHSAAAGNPSMRPEPTPSGRGRRTAPVMTADLIEDGGDARDHPRSWYAATARPPTTRPRLQGTHGCDVVVIGAGFTGLSAALHLAAAGRRTVVLEAQRVGWGASGRNGGQVGTGFSRDQFEIERTLGRSTAKPLFQLAEAAKALVGELCERHAIACDLRPGVASVAHRPDLVAGLRRHVAHLNEDYDHQAIRFLDRDELQAVLASPAFHAAAYDTSAGHLHPLNYALGLAAAAERSGATIHEASRVTAIETRASGQVGVRTAAGKVRADHVVLAGNGYMEGLAPDVEARIMPINNYIVATKSLGEAGARALIGNDAAFADTRFVVNYFRLSTDHRLLFGGGETYRYRFPKDIAALVRPHLERVFPQLRGIDIDYAWGGRLAITRRRLPLLRRLGDRGVAACGYSGQGVALATLAGKLAAEAVQGASAGFDSLAAIPHRPFPGGRAARWPLLVMAMSWFALRDRLGF